MPVVNRITLVFDTDDGRKLNPVSFDVRDGKSSYETWLGLPGNAGKSEQDFIDYLRYTIPVLQEMGQSTEGVMSQKASTDALNKKTDKTTKVNGKPLDKDIVLKAVDVNALPDTGGVVSGQVTIVFDNGQPGLVVSRADSDNNVIMAFKGKTKTNYLGFGDDGKLYFGTNIDVRGTGEQIYTTKNRPTPGDLNAYTKPETDAKIKAATDPKFNKSDVSQTIGTSPDKVMSQKVTTDELAKKVDKSTKVNGKALTGDVQLVPGDVGTYSKAEIDSKLDTNVGNAVAKADVVQTTGTSTDKIMSQKATTDQLNTKVDKTIKVNGKALDKDVNLVAGDVNAYTKQETNTELGKKLDRVQLKDAEGQSATDIMSQRAVTESLAGKVPNVRKVNGKPLSSDISLTPGDVGAFSKEESNTALDKKVDKTAITQVTGASTTQIPSQKLVTDQLGTKADKSTKVNGKPLTGDVTLAPGDVGAYSKGEIDTKLQAAANNALQKDELADTIGTSSETAMSQKATTAHLGTKVPTSRKVNGKELTTDVSLVAGDVNAYTKAEVDAKVQATGGAAVSKTDILQTTGTGTDKLMSQKATTDALNTKVPTGRKINGKALTGDISLTHTDVGAIGRNEAAEDSLRLGGATPSTGGTGSTVAVRNSAGELAAKSLITTIPKTASPVAGSEFAIRSAVNKGLEFIDTAHATSLLGVPSNTEFNAGLAAKVPTSRKVNGKALTGDITLAAVDVGAFKANGPIGSADSIDAVAWDAESGVYRAATAEASAMVVHFRGAGSCPAAQLRFHYNTGGMFYRSARDSYGFESSWSEIYTSSNKPSPAEIGAYTKAEVDSKVLWKDGSYITPKSDKWVQAGGPNTGFLPSASGAKGSGKSNLGTSDWWFDSSYVDNVHAQTVTTDTLETPVANITQARIGEEVHNVVRYESTTTSDYAVIKTKIPAQNNIMANLRINGRGIMGQTYMSQVQMYLSWYRYSGAIHDVNMSIQGFFSDASALNRELEIYEKDGFIEIAVPTTHFASFSVDALNRESKGLTNDMLVGWTVVPTATVDVEALPDTTKPVVQEMYSTGNRPSPAEIGTYSKAEVDGEVVKVKEDLANLGFTRLATHKMTDYVQTAFLIAPSAKSYRAKHGKYMDHYSGVIRVRTSRFDGNPREGRFDISFHSGYQTDGIHADFFGTNHDEWKFVKLEYQGETWIALVSGENPQTTFIAVDGLVSYVDGSQESVVTDYNAHFFKRFDLVRKEPGKDPVYIDQTMFDSMVPLKEEDVNTKMIGLYNLFGNRYLDTSLTSYIAEPDHVPMLNDGGDLTVNTVRPVIPNNTKALPTTAALPFRMDNDENNHLLFTTNRTQVKNWLGLTVSDIGAFKADGPTQKDLDWDSPSGVYTQAFETGYGLVLQMFGSSSTRSAQLRFHYRNGGIWYRSSRDTHGFEEDWSEIYTSSNKPSPAEIGSYTKAEVDTKLNSYYFPRKQWVGKVRKGLWSRILKITPGLDYTWNHTLNLKVHHTRSNVVCSAVFVVSADQGSDRSHVINQLIASTYSKFKVRIEKDKDNSNNAWISILDENQGDGDFNYACEVSGSSRFTTQGTFLAGDDAGEISVIVAGSSSGFIGDGSGLTNLRLNQGTRYWEYEAKGGETQLDPGMTFTDCELYINGMYQPKSYSFVVENNIVTLAGPLIAGEHVDLKVF